MLDSTISLDKANKLIKSLSSNPDIKGLTIMGSLAFLWVYAYYQSLWLAIPSMFLVLVGLPWYRRSYKEKNIRVLTRAFRDALHSIKTSLGAGISLEQSIRRVPKDLDVLYDSKHPLIEAFAQLIRRLDMRIPVEEAFDMMAKGLNIPDITILAKMIRMGKRSGVNMVTVMHISIQALEEKNQIHEEIETMLSARRLEQCILIMMPLIMIILLNCSMGSYMTPLYKTVAGRIVMTIALALQGLGAWLIYKIGDIRI